MWQSEREHIIQAIVRIKKRRAHQPPEQRQSLPADLSRDRSREETYGQSHRREIRFRGRSFFGLHCERIQNLEQITGFHRTCMHWTRYRDRASLNASDDTFSKMRSEVSIAMPPSQEKTATDQRDNNETLYGNIHAKKASTWQLTLKTQNARSMRSRRFTRILEAANRRKRIGDY